MLKCSMGHAVWEVGVLECSKQMHLITCPPCFVGLAVREVGVLSYKEHAYPLIHVCVCVPALLHGIGISLPVCLQMVYKDACAHTPCAHTHTHTHINNITCMQTHKHTHTSHLTTRVHYNRLNNSLTHTHTHHAFPHLTTHLYQHLHTHTYTHICYTHIH